MPTTLGWLFHACGGVLDEVEDDESDVRPTALVTLFRLSTVSNAGPLLKKSTRMNVGWRPPYAVLQVLAALPRFPVPPEGAFVVDT